MTRRTTKSVRIGNIFVGSSHPIVIQSMTNTDTEDIAATVEQVLALANSGSEIVRLTVNTIKAGESIKPIREKLWEKGCFVPLVGDFHFNGHKILASSKDCAKYLDKYRINPGNVGVGNKKDAQFGYMVSQAIEHNKPIRIGVNWGSLDQQLLANMMDRNNRLKEPLESSIVMRQAIVASALQSAQRAIEIGLPSDRIIISCKVSQVQDLIHVYTDLAKQCDFPLHLGLTEAGMGNKGVVASTAAIACLLQMGIGDTIRVSLTPKPNESRTQEVEVAKEILQSMGLREFSPVVTACPGCGRTSSNYFQHLTEQVQQHLATQMPKWQPLYKGVVNMKVAVMGCVVNGPGESKLANIGISLPGKDENPVAPVFIDGVKTVTLKGEHIAKEFMDIIDQYVIEHYSV